MLATLRYSAYSDGVFTPVGWADRRTQSFDGGCYAPRSCCASSSEDFFRRWQNDATAGEVAAQYGLNVRTVQRLFARFEQQGDRGIAPDYDACGQQQPTRAAPKTVQKLCQIRREHPRWGSQMIRLELEDDPNIHTLPSARTIRRHLHQAGLQQATVTQATSRLPRLGRAERPHQCWQIDACEFQPLKSGKRVCWLRVVDECSGAYLQTVIFSAARWEHIGRHQIQAAFRDVLCRWGLPERIRSDNGYPWGNSGDFPPEWALWVMGLGIAMVWIDPSSPQQNGVVERSQDVGQDWFEPQTCRCASELQRRADVLDSRQRERYPHRDGHSRLEVYPALKHSGRPYSVGRERSLFQASRVHEALSAWVVTRRVDCNGVVSVYHRGRYVGKQHIGKQVWVYLDPTGPTWVIADETGAQIRTHDAEELTKERICSLSVTTRKGKQRER
jgi:transposase